MAAYKTTPAFGHIYRAKLDKILNSMSNGHSNYGVQLFFWVVGVKKNETGQFLCGFCGVRINRDKTEVLYK